jgi:hypothetical protein
MQDGGPKIQEEMTEILQVNLNHCRASQDLLFQVVNERKIGLVIVSEPYRILDNPGWFSSEDGLAAIWITGNAGNLLVSDSKSGIGFVGVELGGKTVVSCYFSPNKPTGDFEKFLQLLEVAFPWTHGDFLLAGDFNAKSASWGSNTTDARGEILDAFTEQLELIPLNSGREYTCVRRGGGSVVDVTFATRRQAPLVFNWSVDTVSETLSDHRYIRYSMGARPARVSPTDSKAVLGWVTNKADKDRFRTGFRDALAAVDFGAEASADDLADALVCSVTSACNQSMPRKHPPRNGRPPVYWWNPDIAAIRRKCVAARRRILRARRRSGHVALPEMEDELRAARRKLKSAIATSKNQAWDDLIQEVEDDPWGRPYRMVLKRFKGKPPATQMEPRTMDDVVKGLFPEHPPMDLDLPPLEEEENIPEVSKEEVTEIIKRVRRSKKAPGPDCIPSSVWGMVFDVEPFLLPMCFSRCLEKGSFPKRWKKARLVLLKKGQKPDGVPSSYRPLCLLDDVGKIFERLLAGRLEHHLESKGGLADGQYGFRKGRSTCDAALTLREVVSEACNAQGYCAAVSLDVRNAFNSIPFGKVLGALVRLEVPRYILRIMRSYFQERFITYGVNGGDVRVRQVMAGVPQGSVLGPLLWNIAFDGLLRAPLPTGARVICFADDTLVVVTRNSGWEVEETMTATLRIVSDWMTNAGLELAVQKTECVGFSNRYKYWPDHFLLQDKRLELQPGMTYLGLQIERNFRFRKHLEAAANRASKYLASLSLLMPNVKGPGDKTRRLYAAVVHSILLYGAPVWAFCCRSGPDNWIGRAQSVQRRVALRCIRGYRTVSNEAAGILAGIPPLDLLAREREEVFLMITGRTLTPVEGSKERIRKERREKTIARWSQRLQTTTKGAWTRKLVEDVGLWVGRKHGLMSFHLTQAMTGHGCFNEYLYRFGKAPSPGCAHCEASIDDAEHTLFNCSAWSDYRLELERDLGRPYTPETMVPIMLESEELWNLIQNFVEHVMSTKEEAERERQRVNTP